MKPPATTRRSPPGSDAWKQPWAQLRSPTYHPSVYRRMVGATSPGLEPGDLVHVYDRDGVRFGAAFWNPHSEIRLRMVRYGGEPADEEYFAGLFRAAAGLRRDVLGLGADEGTNAWRAIHAEGDRLSGIVADRYDDVLSVEVYSYGVWRRIAQWLPLLHETIGTKRAVIKVDDVTQRREGIDDVPEESVVGSVRIREHGVRYAVDFRTGHKTGFFCDQRENRQAFAAACGGRSVLDVCCYTGGFAVSAATIGAAREVTGVDLDEAAIDQARHNANLNQVRVNWVHSDAFGWLRQAQQNERSFERVVLDPPKLILSREERELGRRKYHDLNRLAISLVAPGGLFLTCSCSGMLGRDDFQEMVVSASHRQGRRLQILRTTEAAPDHPVSSNCLESRYLKALWCRVL